MISQTKAEEEQGRESSPTYGVFVAPSTICVLAGGLLGFFDMCRGGGGVGPGWMFKLKTVRRMLECRNKFRNAD